ncbi:MAG TPA: TIR domain-containing protein [Roseiarcus sp.]
MSADVFISYSARDRDYANIIALALKNEGLTIWWDASLLPGQAWEEQIFKALKEARLIMPIVSRASAGQKESFAIRQLRFAIENTLMIAPVTIGDFALDELPLGHVLGRRQSFRFDESQPDQSAREIAAKVARLVRSFQAKPPLIPDVALQRFAPDADDTSRPVSDQRSDDDALRQLAVDAAETAREVSNPPPAKADETPASIFVVHGHDLEMLDAVAAELSNLNVEPVILNRVRTSDDHLFAKFRAVADKARHAIVLIAGDDVGASFTDFFHPAGGTPTCSFAPGRTCCSSSDSSTANSARKTCSYSKNRRRRRRKCCPVSSSHPTFRERFMRISPATGRPLCVSVSMTPAL